MPFYPLTSLLRTPTALNSSSAPISIDDLDFEQQLAFMEHHTGNRDSQSYYLNTLLAPLNGTNPSLDDDSQFQEIDQNIAVRGGVILRPLHRPHRFFDPRWNEWKKFKSYIQPWGWKTRRYDRRTNLFET
jgi:hypothetical protein